MPPCNSISKEDRASIEKLREAVRDKLTPYYDTDFNLLRWLQGHDYNFDIIIPKLKNHLLLRKSRWDLDKLADKPRNHPLHFYWKAGLTGPAVKTPNVIVNIEQTGRNDYWGMMQTFSVIDIMAARTHDLELQLRRVMEMEAKTGEQAFIMYVMDLTDLKYDKHLLTLVTGALSCISTFMSDHYVEMIHKFALVNAPSFIASIWAIAKPLLPERTRDKVSIFGSNWKTEIQNMIVPEVFKAELELSVPIDPQQYCKEKMNGDCEILSILAGKTETIDISAEKDSVIRWCLQANGDFGFTILYAENEACNQSNSLINIYPILVKVPGPTVVPIRDELKCAKSGIYKFRFSNEHAWFHTLNIRYSVDVELKRE
uniref:CRAL-TRIO domain-containing protein n=1 Tax=Setaria digitata TaxID=48799 RepID=A0A915Q698_9BILA